MGEWRKCNLGEHAVFTQGLQVPIEEQSIIPFDGSIRFIRIVDFTKNDKGEIRYIKYPGDRYLVHEDDLVMIRYGSQTAGKIAKGFYGIIANNTFKITPNEYFDKIFLYYYLTQKSIYNFFRDSQSSSTMPAITFSMIGNLKIVMPPLPEQKAIASVLSSLDDKIDLLHRQNKTLEAMAETLFRQWFVEDARDDWEEVTLGEVADIKAGGDKPKHFSKRKTERYNIPIYSNGIDNEGLYGYTDSARIQAESITVSARGTIGFVCLRQEPYVPIVRLISIIPNDNFISSKYLYLWAKSQDIMGTGTTQQQLTVPDFSRTSFIIPPLEKMKKFTNYVDTFFVKMKFNETQISTLEKLRDTLLPKLMSGEVRVEYEH
ncbi:MAG: restriction endonuclease subunit S [Desulfotignum sp.]|nr:restriction endonuclease subunit S [Desulfotignum sp.]MCF8138347.1 restriction endonuclease subunit S [Desulfotignum sp.]